MEPMIHMHIAVNTTVRVVNALPKLSLLRLLRYDLGPTGALRPRSPQAHLS